MTAEPPSDAGADHDTATWPFPLVPLTPVIQAYLDRFNARPSVARVKARDAALAATQAAAQG